MMLFPKPTKLCFPRSNFLHNTLRALRTKSNNPFEDDDKHRIRKPKANQDEYLDLHKSKGQHLLTNTRILDTIVRKSDIKPSDTVLEIGPGTGNLTLKLLQVARKVAAVELDRRMVDILQKRVADHGLGDGLDIICKDAMKVEFPPFDLVVANIPYKISSPLVAKLVYGRNRFRSATLLVQKEFARRLVANPGDSEFNRLAVNVKLVADVELVMDVSKREFVPPPKVDSSVVIIWPKAEIPDVNLDEWWAFTRTCFNKKNKTLGAMFKQKKKVIELLKLASSSNGLNDISRIDEGKHDGDEEGGSESEEAEDLSESSCSNFETNSFKEKIVEVLRSEGFEDKRPSKLCIEEFLHLLSKFNHSGIYFHNQQQSKSLDCTPAELFIE